MSKLFQRRQSSGLDSFLFSSISGVKQSVNVALRDNSDGLADNRKKILTGTIFNNIAASMTGGIFFTGLVLILLKDEPNSIRNAYLGNMATLQLFCGMFQLAAPFFVEKMKRRRGFVMSFRTLYHVINTFLLALVPVLPMASTAKADVFMTLVAIMTAANAIATPPISAWHLHSLTKSRRGDYYAIQSMALPCINTLAAFLSGLVMDGFKAQGNEFIAILILRGAAIFFIAMETRAYFRVTEPVYHQSETMPKLREIVTVPFRNPKFLLMVLIAVIWAISANIPGQFFAAYQLQDAKLSYTYINVCNFLNIPILLIMIPFWNRKIHKYGWLPVLSVSVFLYGFAYVFNACLSVNTQYFYIISAVYCNAVSPGVTLGMANLPYLKIPKESQSSCIAFYNSVCSLAGCASAFMAKYFMLATDGVFLDIFGWQIKNGRILTCCLLPSPPCCL